MAPFGDRRDVRVAIIGSGFGGLGAAMQLKARGVDDFVVLERADDVGGTWRDNSYPGCACDVQSHLYSFSFAQNPEWSRSYSPQPEIWRYLQQCAREAGVMPHVRFGHEMLGARWDEAAQRWRVETSQGVYTASVVVLATGPLSDPVIPQLPGLESFRGKTFHSAQWDHAYDLAGKRVAVIGTGASAIQFVPEIQPVVEQLYLFQRTAPWILPRLERDIGVRARRVFRRVPAVQRAVRSAIYSGRELMVMLFRNPRLMRRTQGIAERYLQRKVRDPELRKKLTPNFTLGCKRVLLSNTYLSAVTQPNVDVITTGIAEVRASSIVGNDGVERPVDAIIFGTGFRPTDSPAAQHLIGRDGKSLSEVWGGSPQAYLGTTVNGFPNLFILLGPNTGLGHTSVVYMIEAQIAHLMDALRYMERHDVGVMEPKADAQAAFIRGIDERMRGTVWVAGGCKSWYLDETGRNSTLWPDFTWQYRRRVERIDPSAYRMAPAHGAARMAEARESTQEYTRERAYA